MMVRLTWVLSCKVQILARIFGGSAALELSRPGFLSLAGCSFDCAVTRQDSGGTVCAGIHRLLYHYLHKITTTKTESRAIVLTFLLDALPLAGRFYIRCENAAEHVDTLRKCSRRLNGERV